ncbi:MAG: molybdopterin-dependent oxidoreductase, partial [bacterium]|nr:molybdopterin-dependent oxidoreductase [bacterium]
MGMRRRDFIKLLTGTTTFSLAYGYGLFSNLEAKGPGAAWAADIDHDLLRPPKETWIPSVCQQCQGGCGIVVRVYGDRAVKIDGNPLHPINRGTLCARGQSGLQWLYDPDRIKGPLARSGDRGEGKWKSITWDEALATVVEKLEKLRQAERPHALALLTGAQGEGLRRQISERFMEAYGSPNIIRCEPDRSAGRVPAIQLMQGQAAGVTYDIEDAGYILSLNSALLEDHWSAVQVSQAFGKFRRGRHKLRGKLVHAESRLSTTGAKADQWVPIHPGTEGILAMGIASVLIIEKRYDEDFLRQRTFGFDDWRDKAGRLRPGFKTVVIRDYPLERVVETTGVPRDTIITMAREFARTPRAMAMGNDNPVIGGQEIHNRMAIHALNALVGNIQVQGGILSQARLPDIGLSPYTPDGIAVNGLSMERLDGADTHEYALAHDVPASLADRIETKRPYPLEMVFLHGANPLYTAPEPEKLLSALKQVPTIVSFSSFMDETSRYADLIL